MRMSSLFMCVLYIIMYLHTEISLHPFTCYKVPKTNSGVGIFLWSKVLPVYPRKPQIVLFLTQIVSFLPLVHYHGW